MDEATFEDRLRRSSASRLADQPGDSDLTTVFELVATRRARRAAGRADERVADQPPNRIPGPTGPGTVVAVEVLSPRLRVLRVVRPPGLRFRAGQYVKVGAGGSRRRSFSLASAPHEPLLELCVGLMPGGVVTPRLFSLRPGDRVEVGSNAKGSFRLEAGVAHHLMVATGTGIAPLRSMVRDALHRGAADRFTILHGASHAAGLPYRAELTALAATNDAVTYEPTISRPSAAPNAGWDRSTGRVDVLAQGRLSTLDVQDTHVYACGNGAMVGNVARMFAEAGFRVSTETFD